MLSYTERYSQWLNLAIPIFHDHSMLLGSILTSTGQAAMAASISLRSYLLVSPTPSGPRQIVLEFPDIKLNHTWDLDTLPFAAFSNSAKAKRFDDRLTSLDSDLVAALEPHIASVSTHLPEKARHQHHAAASCFLYLLLSLGSPAMPACTY